MSFIASYEIWSERQVPEVHGNLAAIAKTIAKYEPVSLLVRKEDFGIAQELLGGGHGHPYNNRNPNTTKAEVANELMELPVVEAVFIVQQHRNQWSNRVSPPDSSSRNLCCSVLTSKCINGNNVRNDRLSEKHLDYVRALRSFRHGSIRNILIPLKVI